MTERPVPVDTLDRWLGASRIAHETAFDLYVKVVNSGRAADHARELLVESTDIAVRAATALTSDGRSLVREWDEQRVLAPEDARRTLDKLEAELARIEPAIAQLLERHATIARTLHRLLAER